MLEPVIITAQNLARFLELGYCFVILDFLVISLDLSMSPGSIL